LPAPRRRHRYHGGSLLHVPHDQVPKVRRVRDVLLFERQLLHDVHLKGGRSHEISKRRTGQTPPGAALQHGLHWLLTIVRPRRRPDETIHAYVVRAKLVAELERELIAELDRALLREKGYGTRRRKSG
jgi:hypothetical protein